MMDSVPNFTPRAQEAIKKSRDVALHYKVKVVRLEHLLLGLLSQGRGLLREIFNIGGYDLDAFRAFVETSLKRGRAESGQVKFAAEVKTILELSHQCASDLQQPYVGTEHLLLSIIKFNTPTIKKLFKEGGIQAKNLITALRSQLLESTQAPIPEDLALLHQGLGRETKDSPSKPSALDAFSINYNHLAAAGKFSEVVCRDNSLLEVTEILCRRTKNNPLLLGEPGIGKTALIEGLSKQIVSGNCADHLLGHVICGLDLASMIAGTKYRGQFEERLKNVIKELQTIPNLILFIDEIHTLVGAGSAEGTMDAANILKPMLARGEMRCIGATTFPEYKKSIEKDGALARRFQPVLLKEPSTGDCKKILNSLVPVYEDFHFVQYDPAAVDACVDLSVKYIHDRHLPDKAIDLLDQSGAKVKIENLKRPVKAKNLEKKLEELMIAEDEATSHPLKAELAKEQEKLFQEYKKVLGRWSKSNESKAFAVTLQAIQELVAHKIGVPLSQVSSSFVEKLTALENTLNSEVVGQPQATKSIAEALIRNRAGLNNDKRPIGSFLLLGASGTGKTYIAETLATKLFGGKDNFIPVNMSEYSESFTSSKLIGAAPGYVGYDQAGQLTEAVRKNPYSVVLFDEVEKAHENVIQMLLQILDQGIIRDNMGREINFRNCIIIITGNVGSEFTKGKGTMAFHLSSEDDTAAIEEKVKGAARKRFPPEFLNRLDDVIVFQNFATDEYNKIIKMRLDSLKSKVKDRGVTLRVYKKAITHLSKLVLSENDGARPIDRIIQNEISTFIALRLLKRDENPFDKITVTAVNESLVFKYI